MKMSANDAQTHSHLYTNTYILFENSHEIFLPWYCYGEMLAKHTYIHIYMLYNVGSHTNVQSEIRHQKNINR